MKDTLNRCSECGESPVAYLMIDLKTHLARTFVSCINCRERVVVEKTKHTAVRSWNKANPLGKNTGTIPNNHTEDL